MTARIAMVLALAVAGQPGVLCQWDITNAPVTPPSPAPHSYDAHESVSGLPWLRWITGRVVLEDGGKLPWSPDVTSPFCEVKVAGSSFSVKVLGPINGESPVGTHGGCNLTVSLPGFRSQRVWAYDGIVVKLHRLGEREGSTISITILSTPKDAQKAYQAGRIAALRQEWSKAQTRFEEAVSVYRGHAAAWDELGSVLEREGKPRESVAAYQKAIDADPKFIKPYVHLAGLAVRELRWSDAVGMAEAAIRLHAIEFPAAYLYHAQAAVVLEQWDAAEMSAREAVRLDTEREYPLARYILAVLLDRKGETSEAREYFVQYLAMVPDASAAAAIRQRINELEMGAR